MGPASVPGSESVRHLARQGEHGRTVQFYRDAAYPLDTLSQQIGEALAAGGVAIVIASRAHRDDLAQRLKERGLDVAGATQQGRLETLSGRGKICQCPDRAPCLEDFLCYSI